ncbi:MAG: hypothetical protein IJ416_06795 [Ruminiclostridium sp.]|nr:hypothetical protein [Ruminiclostridium sp.]
MKKAVDVNARTLEEEKKDFVLICKVFEVLCIVITAVFAFIAVVVTGISVSLGAGIKDVLVFSANSAILLFGMISALNFGRTIFKSLKSGETPFRYDIADKVKGASLALLLSSFLSILVLGGSCLISEAFAGICHYYFFILMSGFVAGGILGIMSYVMNYGCKLQQESDETV